MSKEKAIVDKIKELFDYRGIDRIAREYGLLREPVYQLLLDIQYHIFLYDKYLEDNWIAEPFQLDVLWSNIELSMQKIGCSTEESRRYLGEIRTYARNELSTRKGIGLCTLPISYFYYFKSCDVRLMRRLLRREKGHKLNVFADGEWMIFDWVTEVNDDISDVKEDLNTYNGNRFLHSYMTLGGDETRRAYAHFLGMLKKKLEAGSNKSNTREDSIRQTAMAEIENTFQKMESILEELQHSPLKQFNGPYLAMR